jgi:hypothetical protein
LFTSSSRVVLGEFSVWVARNASVKRRFMCNTWSVRLWYFCVEIRCYKTTNETGNPSACATVNWKVCKWAIALYCLRVSVIQGGCVSQLLINPIIRIKTRLINEVYHYTRHSIMALQVFVRLWLLFQFLNLNTDGRTPWTGDQPVARPLPTQRTTLAQNKHTQTSMPRVRFEPTTPVLDRVKTVNVCTTYTRGKNRCRRTLRTGL